MEVLEGVEVLRGAHGVAMRASEIPVRMTGRSRAWTEPSIREVRGEAPARAFKRRFVPGVANRRLGRMAGGLRPSAQALMAGRPPIGVVVAPGHYTVSALCGLGYLHVLHG